MANDIYTFTGAEGVFEPKPKDVDLDRDSPHHTIGKGPTQAAAGNHVHKVVDVTDLSQGTDHTHNDVYSQLGHTHLGVDHDHSSIYADVYHTHEGGGVGGSIALRLLTHDFGNIAAETTESVLLSRTGADEVPVAVYSVINATNYTWGVGFPDNDTFRVYIRNQSGSSNNVGTVYIIMSHVYVA